MEVLFCIFFMFYQLLTKTWIQIQITGTDAYTFMLYFLVSFPPLTKIFCSWSLYWRSGAVWFRRTWVRQNWTRPGGHWRLQWTRPVPNIYTLLNSAPRRKWTILIFSRIANIVADSQHLDGDQDPIIHFDAYLDPDPVPTFWAALFRLRHSVALFWASSLVRKYLFSAS
jgi:hypothetical protein